MGFCKMNKGLPRQPFIMLICKVDILFTQNEWFVGLHQKTIG